MQRWTRRQFVKISSAAAIQLMVMPRRLLARTNTNRQSQLERLQRMQSSHQFKDGKFVNPIDAPMMAEGSTWKYIQKRFFTDRPDPEPPGKLPVTPVQAGDWINTRKDSVSFAWLGHASILMALDGKTILVDPVLEKRASPFAWIGPKRFHPPPVKAGGLPPIDVVLITHDHYDHLEAPTMKQLKDSTGLFLVPLGIGALLEAWGIAPEKVVELDWWEQHVFGPLTFTATPGVHYARRGVFDGDERLWCSWSIAGQSRKLFVSGDSGYFDGFKKIGHELGPFDVTFLKVGSYDDMWKQIHMLPEEAVQQHRDLFGSLMVPLHWATFDLALHPWYEPIERALAAAEKAGQRVVAPLIGEKVDLDHLAEADAWWRDVM
jgi:L-ascorbate metabolism protein UlaG (beta-lactamase superfamily)